MLHDTYEKFDDKRMDDLIARLRRSSVQRSNDNSIDEFESRREEREERQRERAEEEHQYQEDAFRNAERMWHEDE